MLAAMKEKFVWVGPLHKDFWNAQSTEKHILKNSQTLDSFKTMEN